MRSSGSAWKRKISLDPLPSLLLTLTREIARHSVGSGMRLEVRFRAVVRRARPRYTIPWSICMHSGIRQSRREFPMFFGMSSERTRALRF